MDTEAKGNNNHGNNHGSNNQDVVVVHRSPTKRKGFAQIPHAVLTDPTLSDGAVRLYGILLSYAFQGESFKCSQAKMAADTAKDDRTVRRLLTELNKRGLVTAVRQGQRLVNIYILEDAYALYDSEQPRPGTRIRSTKTKQQKRNEITEAKIGPDKNVRSESDRTKMSGPVGQKCPVPQDKNVRLLKTPEKESQKELTLNVGEDVNFVDESPIDQNSERAKSSLPISLRPDLDEQAEALAAELHDHASIRRHRQLLAICDRNQLSHLPANALQAVRKRQASEGRAGALEKPGAYYQSILIGLMEEHQVFVPKAGEEDADEVRMMVRGSLGL